MYRYIRRGFSLLEILIALLILGIILVFVSPQVADYIKETRFVAHIELARAYQTQVEECLRDTGQLGRCDAGINGIQSVPANLPDTIHSVTVTDGVITVNAESDTFMNGETLILTPTLPNTGGVAWALTGNCASAGLCATENFSQ